MDFKKFLRLRQGLWSFLCYKFQIKIRLSINSLFHVKIGNFKFSSLFKESPCSPVVTFPSFGSEGHGVQPPQGDSFFSYLCSTSHRFFRTIFFWRSFKLGHVNVKNPLKKGHQICLTVNYMRLFKSFFI